MTLIRGMQRGFTLIELLAVTAIVAVILGMTVVKLQRSDSTRVQEAAEKLGMALERARDSATISGKSVAFSSDGSGYQFWSADAVTGEWKPMDEEYLGPQRFPDGVHLMQWQVNGHSRPMGERLVFSADGVADTFEMNLSAGQATMQLSADVMGRIELLNAIR